MSTPSPNALMTVPEMAAMLAIGKTTAWKLIQTRAVPAIRIGRAVRIRRGDVEAYIKNNEY